MTSSSRLCLPLCLFLLLNTTPSLAFNPVLIAVHIESDVQGELRGDLHIAPKDGGIEAASLKACRWRMDSSWCNCSGRRAK